MSHWHPQAALCWARAAPMSHVVERGKQTLQWGQTKPAMFSTTPSTGTFTLWQKLGTHGSEDSDAMRRCERMQRPAVLSCGLCLCLHVLGCVADVISLRTSSSAISCGVVTMTAPSTCACVM